MLITTRKSTTSLCSLQLNFCSPTSQLTFIDKQLNAIMGILRNKEERKLFKVEDEAVPEEHQITYADYVFDDTENESSEDETPVVQHREPLNRRPQRRLPIKTPLNMLGYDGPRIKSGMGARKLRRLEHNRLLLSLTDPEDICEDLSDLIPETMNAFSQLFIEQSKMKVWDNFINLDESEQQHILDEIDGKVPHDPKNGHILGGRYSADRKGAKASGNTKAKPGTSTSSDDTKRAHHPAYSGKACFKRMDRRAREVMMQKHLPWSFINATEQDLIDFFSSDPDGVWINTLQNGNERLYVHAISQYLSLISESSTDTTDQRVTEVRNTKSFFVPPRATLLEYVSEHKKNRKPQNANSDF
uniref:R3H-assoc domain-containing protein n=1 Tax=Steinernema glaseri TaxID=37863 RepID=A0A1I7YRU8_9BILA